MFENAKCVKQLTRTSKEIDDSKTVWIFTNEHDPISGNVEERELMECASKDLVDSDVDIRLWALPRSARGVFDRSLFYYYIATVESDGDDEAEAGNLPQGSPAEEDLDLDGLLMKFLASWSKVRKFQTIPMFLPDWKELYKGEASKGGEDGNDSDDEMVGNGSGAASSSAHPGIMLDLYQTIRIKKKPIATTIYSRTNK